VSHEETASNPERRRRPLGVAILAVLHGLGGVLVTILFVALVATEGTQQWAQQRGIPLAVVAGVGGLGGALFLASSYGLWTGAKFGWWFNAWYYVTDSVGHGLFLALAPLASRNLNGEAFTEFVLKHAVRGFISIALACYFFRRKVLLYFHLQSIARWKTAGFLAGLGVLFLLGLGLLIVGFSILQPRR
jgi:hypothetical protein